MLGTEREDHRVVVGGGLQLEVERHAETLAQRQAEGAVDAPAEGRVHNELRPLALVEATLHHNALAGGEEAERGQPGGTVRHHLLGHLERDAGPLHHQAARPLAVLLAQEGFEGGPQITHRHGQLGRARRGLAQPEGDGRGQVAGVVDPHGADLDLLHPPRVGAEEEDVPGGRLHGEVLVHRPDGDALGVEDDPVVTGLGDGSPAGQRGQAGAPPGPQAPVDRIVVEMGAATAPSGLDAPARQGHHVVEVLTGQVGVGGGPPRHVPHLLDPALLGRRHFGHQLLGQDVERGDRRLQEVQPTLADGGQERGALDQLVPGHRIEPARRHPVALVVGPPDPLEEGPDGAGRADLADQLDRPDVDAQFQRGRGHQCAQVAGPQAGLDDPPARRREAPVVRRHQE